MEDLATYLQQLSVKNNVITPIIRLSHTVTHRVKNDLATFLFSIESNLFDNPSKSYDSMVNVIQSIQRLLNKKEYQVLEVEINHEVKEEFEYIKNQPKKSLGYRAISQLIYKIFVASNPPNNDDDNKYDNNNDIASHNATNKMAKAVELQDKIMSVKWDEGNVLIKSITYNLSELRKYIHKQETIVEVIKKIKDQAALVVSTTYPPQVTDRCGDRKTYNIESTQVSTHYRESQSPYYPKQHTYQAESSYRSNYSNDKIVVINAQGFSSVITDISMKISVQNINK